MTEPTFPVIPDPAADTGQENAVETASIQLQLEISKMLLSNSLSATRGSLQIMQGLTSALLTSYITLLVGFGKQIGVDKIPALLSVLPILFYASSLIVGFAQVAVSRGASLVLGDLSSGIEAYESLISTQRKQLIIPLLLALAGLIAVVIVAIKLLGIQQTVA